MERAFRIFQPQQISAGGPVPGSSAGGGGGVKGGWGQEMTLNLKKGSSVSQAICQSCACISSTQGPMKMCFHLSHSTREESELGGLD